MPEYHFDKVAVLLSKKDIPAQAFLCESHKNVYKIFFCSVYRESGNLFLSTPTITGHNLD